MKTLKLKLKARDQDFEDLMADYDALKAEMGERGAMVCAGVCAGPRPGVCAGADAGLGVCGACVRACVCVCVCVSECLLIFRKAPGLQTLMTALL